MPSTAAESSPPESSSLTVGLVALQSGTVQTIIHEPEANRPMASGVIYNGPDRPSLEALLQHNQIAMAILETSARSTSHPRSSPSLPCLAE